MENNFEVLEYDLGIHVFFFLMYVHMAEWNKYLPQTLNLKVGCVNGLQLTRDNDTQCDRCWHRSVSSVG